MPYTAMGPPEKQWKQRGLIDCSVLFLFLLFVAAGNLSILASTRHNGHRDSSSNRSIKLAAVEQLAVDLGPTTESPMMPQPPFSNGHCFPRHNVPNDMHEFGCPVLNCSLDAACTVADISCCASVNYMLLDFLDRFLTANCLQEEYMLAHGTILGAVRDRPEGIIPFTEDIDVALTPLAVQFLELNSSKGALWRHGYTFWAHLKRGIWKICPHLHHPSPHIQELMLPGVTVKQYHNQTGRLMGGYLDGWLMWQVPDATQRCSDHNITDLPAALATPWDGDREALSAGVDVCGLQAAPQADSASDSQAAPQQAPRRSGQRAGWRQPDNTTVTSTATKGTFCMKESEAPHVMQAGLREARFAIAGKAFPIPFNYEEVMEANYGAGWRLPEPGFHGNRVPKGNEPRLREALLEKLSVTAWGDMPWQERKEACGVKSS